MTFLLDTNVLSDLMRRHPALEAHPERLSASDRVITCTIARGEILYGLARLPSGQRRAQLELKAANLFGVLHCESIPELAADRYAVVKFARERRGLAMDENDLWIVATALALGATLVSRDTDVRQVDNLMVENWTV